MFWDLSAIALAVAAILLRWYDDPRSSSLLAYLSIACSAIGRNRTFGHKAAESSRPE